MKNTPLPKRKLIKGKTFKVTEGDRDLIGTKFIGKDSWVYADPDQQALALKVSMTWGFDLPNFDAWLENLKQSKVKSELIERRVQLIKEKSKFLKGSLEFLKLGRLLIKQKSGLSKGGENAMKIKLRKSDNLYSRIAEMYTSTKLDHEKKDTACYNSHVIAAFSKKYKDEKPITDYLIRVSMAAPRTAL